MDKNNQPVFFDPNNKRWPRVKNSFIVLTFLVFLLCIIFLISIYLTPALNKLPLSTVNRLTNINYNVNKIITAPKHQFLLHKWQASLKNKMPKLIANNKNSYRPMIMAFLVNYDDASFQSLIKNLNSIDVVIGDFLHLKTSQGDLIEDDSDKQKIITDYIIKHKPQTKIIPLISNVKNGDWQSKMISEVLS